MTTHVIMNVDRPNGSGDTYKAGLEYDLPDDLAALWRGQGVCRLTSVRSEQTGVVVSAVSGNFPDAPARDKSVPLTATLSSGEVNFYVGDSRIPLYKTSQTAVPVILVPSGTFTSTAGAITMGTALSAIPAGSIAGGGNAYIYLPPGAGGLSGGLYAATFTSTTQCQLIGNPTTTATAYTQSTGIVTLGQVAIPGGSMGPSGAVEINVFMGNNNSANAKTLRGGINATTGVMTQQNVGGTSVKTTAEISNRGSESSQYVFGTGVNGSVAAVNTVADWNFVISGQLAVATDYLVIEAVKVRRRSGD